MSATAPLAGCRVRVRVFEHMHDRQTLADARTRACNPEYWRMRVIHQAVQRIYEGPPFAMVLLYCVPGRPVVLQYCTAGGTCLGIGATHDLLGTRMFFRLGTVGTVISTALRRGTGTRSRTLEGSHRIGDQWSWPHGPAALSIQPCNAAQQKPVNHL